MTGYLYILKHGVGPGALPRGVQILKWKDLPNYYTAVWLDRFLSTDEMDDYDIPYETDINYYLDRIGYCQTDDGDDVVPCEDIVATTKIDASVSSKDLKSLAKRVLDCTSFEELSRAIGSLLSIDKDIYCHYMEMLRDESLSLDYIISDLSDTLYNLASCDIYCETDISTDSTPSYRFKNDEYNYLVRGYYDEARRGLAADAWADTLSEVDDIVNEYANSGYYIEFRNLSAGTILEFDPDSWFDNIYPNGGFSGLDL
jgi:hypothetical protein